jgi:hypothetical protein
LAISEAKSLAIEGEHHFVAARAAILLRVADAKVTQFSHLLKKLGGKLTLVIYPGRDRNDLLVHELGQAAAEEFLLFAEVEVHKHLTAFHSRGLKGLREAALSFLRAAQSFLCAALPFLHAAPSFLRVVQRFLLAILPYLYSAAMLAQMHNPSAGSGQNARRPASFAHQPRSRQRKWGRVLSEADGVRWVWDGGTGNDKAHPPGVFAVEPS